MENRTVLITGGTGSFGKKFARLLLAEGNPKKVIVLSRDETKQHRMQQDPAFQDRRMRFFVGDIRDEDRLRRAFSGVDVVVHAAALKHVPSCEYNPLEAVKTNIHGAENIVAAAIDAGVDRVLAISTDKAVNPVNLYGATKLVMEKLIVQANAYSGGKGPKFSCVRYGNVIGSRGSVVPLFIEQRPTGRITITDSRMTRFWITLDQGTRFVWDCVRRMVGGEIFVPKIPSSGLMDVVQAVAPECKVKSIGIRPGEKINEVLVGEDEARHTVDAGDRYIIQPLHPWWNNPIQGKPLAAGFRYDSDQNPDLLDAARVKVLMEKEGFA